MGIQSVLRLTMSYYNNTLALWEPLIEPVEIEGSSGLMEYAPWELNFSLNVDKHLDDPNQDEPTTCIKIKSNETLEMTVTKTCLDVLTNLGNAFSEAIKKEGLIRDGIDAPYVLKNDTGLELQLELLNTEFTFHNTNFYEENKSASVVFEGIAGSPSEEKYSCAIFPGGQVYLQPKFDMNSFSLLDETIKSLNCGTTTESNAQEKFINVFVRNPRSQCKIFAIIQ